MLNALKKLGEIQPLRTPIFFVNECIEYRGHKSGHPYVKFPWRQADLYFRDWHGELSIISSQCKSNQLLG